MKASGRLSIGAMRSWFRQCRATVKDPTCAEATLKQAEAFEERVEKSVADFRELAQMEAQARNNAWKVVEERIQENSVQRA